MAKHPLGDAITEWLDTMGWGQEALAEKSGVPLSTLNRYIRGTKKKHYTPEHLRNLAKAMSWPRHKIFKLAGYVEDTDIGEWPFTAEQEEIAILWNGISTEYRPLMRSMLETAVQHKIRLKGAPVTQLTQDSDVGLVPDEFVLIEMYRASDEVGKASIYGVARKMSHYGEDSSPGQTHEAENRS